MSVDKPNEVRMCAFELNLARWELGTNDVCSNDSYRVIQRKSVL